MTLDFSLLQEPVVNEGPIPKYRAFQRIAYCQPTRATCFHPSGEAYVVGSNSKTLSICLYPTEDILNDSMLEDDCELPIEPRISFKFLQVHRGSVYCVGFNEQGNLLATGSNDQTVKVIKYNPEKHAPQGDEFNLTMHTGTIRDLVFLKGERAHLLATAGAGDFEIYLTDCNTMKPVQMLKGHESSVMSLHAWDESSTFYSGSLDGTIRLWDIRLKSCVATLGQNKLAGDRTGHSANDNGHNSGEQQLKPYNSSTPVGVVRVEPTGRLLVSGHQDGTCMLYDIRAKRVIQSFKAHDNEIRTLNFGPKSYYLLTGGYDHKVKLMDLQGDLGKKLPSVEIVELDDKVVQTAWHPTDYNFVTTSADGTATLWTMSDN